MKIITRHIGSTSGRPATCIEVGISVCGNWLVEDVTDMNRRVDESLIEDLRRVADELEEQNKLLKAKGE